MSHWNYRVVVDRRSKFPSYTIRECYYNHKDDTIPHSWTSEHSATPFGESVDDFKKDISMMLLAFNKPVLMEEFNGKGEAIKLVEDNGK